MSHPLLLAASGADRALANGDFLARRCVQVCNDSDVTYEWDEQARKEAAGYPVSAPDAVILRLQCVRKAADLGPVQSPWP
jgi:hypothetical protein